MGCQVPENVDVLLVQTQVEAGAVDVTDVPELAVVDELAELADRRVVLEGMADHEHDTGVVCALDDGPAVGDARRERLLHEDVATSQGTLDRNLGVRPGWRGDHERVHGREHVADPAGELGGWKRAPSLGKARGARVHDGHSDFGRRAQDPSVLGAPIPVADDSHAHRHCSGSVCAFIAVAVPQFGGVEVRCTLRARISRPHRSLDGAVSREEWG